MTVHAEHAYSPEVTSPSAAREFVSGILREWGRQDLSDVACLLTSELVTNAVVHARTPLAVRISLGAKALRIEIEDSGCPLTGPQAHTAFAENGRGLNIVEALSYGWGARKAPEGGKVVWFDLPIQPVSVPRVRRSQARSQPRWRPR